MITVKSYPLNQIDYSLAVPTSTNSNELIKYLWVDVSEATTDEVIEIVYNGVTTTLLVTDECRYTPLDIAFVNKEGAIQIQTMFKASKESITITSKEFESSAPIGTHQVKRFNVQSKTKFNINSGFVTEDKNESFKQLLLSERVWLIIDGDTIPVNIATKSLEYKTRQNDRLINYNLEIEYAFNDINNV